MKYLLIISTALTTLLWSCSGDDYESEGGEAEVKSISKLIDSKGHLYVGLPTEMGFEVDGSAKRIDVKLVKGEASIDKTGLDQFTITPEKAGTLKLKVSSKENDKSGTISIKTVGEIPFPEFKFLTNTNQPIELSQTQDPNKMFQIRIKAMADPAIDENVDIDSFGFGEECATAELTREGEVIETGQIFGGGFGVVGMVEDILRKVQPGDRINITVNCIKLVTRGMDAKEVMINAPGGKKVFTIQF